MMIGSNNLINMAYNNLSTTNNAIEKTAKALSTGLRVSNAADDAANFGILQNMSAQISGVERAIRNSQDGISMLQTAEGAMNQINSMLQRMRELAVQSANDSLTSQDRSYIQAEINDLRESIDNVASGTTFNQKRLLDGSSTAIWSSDDETTKLKTTGAITLIDNFGQKKQTEGNYRIEVKANAGKGQVQKSAIFNVNSDTTTLEQIPEFYNSSGVFTVNQPQKITITQGNGKTTDVILYSQDTVEDVRKKFNDAISSDLGQGAYTDNIDGFVSFVYEGNETENGLESVAGTFVIRSAVAGSAGKLSFTSDNQDLINILGLNTIQEAEDNTFSVSIFDAHSGKAIAQNISGDGNSITGILSPNMTIEFDSMANVKAHWDENSRSYILTSEAQAYNTILHIHDRSTSFQIGQNLGEDIYINIGDMRAEAIGLNEIDVSTRANASKSISLLDTAIHKVNSQRSKIGAYMNELEYNANSLTNTNLHLQESESRLKDADMALEYMEFIKLQILNSTGNATLTQANQNSQNLMKIMGV